MENLPNIIKAMEPMGERVLIQIDDVQETTSGGILLTQTDQEKPQRGTIIAIGTDANLITKPGYRVAFGKYAGVRFEEENRTYLFLKESEILAIIDKTDAVK